MTSNQLEVTWKRIGPLGGWGNTITAAVWDDALFTIESTGSLFRTDVTSGEWTRIGPLAFLGTKFLLAYKKGLLSEERSGILYRIDPKTGTWEEIAGEFDSIAATVLNDQVYTIRRNGSLCRTEPDTGESEVIADNSFVGTQHLIAARDRLYTIEMTGSLYCVDPKDGSWKIVGEPGGWLNTLATAPIGDRLFTVEANGGLFATDLASGEWRLVGNPDYAQTMFMFAVADVLLTIESMGDLFRFDFH